MMVKWKIYKKDVVEKLHQELHLLRTDTGNAIEFIRSIESKDWKRQYADGHARGQSSLAQSLIDLKNKIIALGRIDDERNWVSNGLASFTEIARNDWSSIDNLGDTVIQFLTSYVSANQGSIYFLHDGDTEQYLELKGCYAYHKQKHVIGSVGVEEGLLGQCFQEGEYIYLTRVPKDYVKITSGLGAATPTCIIIVPLVSNRKKAGIFELAFFDTLQQYQIDFLLKVAEIIASLILSVKDNVHTTELLIKSETLAIQLKAHEEEMRQNLEEMTAMQEKVLRQNKELEQTREELLAKHEELRIIQKQDAALLEAKLKSNNDINQTIIARLKHKIKEIEKRELTNKLYINN